MKHVASLPLDEVSVFVELPVLPSEYHWMLCEGVIDGNHRNLSLTRSSFGLPLHVEVPYPRMEVGDVIRHWVDMLHDLLLVGDVPLERHEFLLYLMDVHRIAEVEPVQWDALTRSAGHDTSGFYGVPDPRASIPSAHSAQFPRMSVLWYPAVW